jgi:hypothetical protein
MSMKNMNKQELRVTDKAPSSQEIFAVDTSHFVCIFFVLVTM